jgi:hypothetical protein
MEDAAMEEKSSMTILVDPRENFLGEFEGDLKPSDFARSSIAPGRFTQFMEYMMVHREMSPDEVVLEYSAPINFVNDGIQMPSGQFQLSNDQQKD